METPDDLSCDVVNETLMDKENKSQEKANKPLSSLIEYNVMDSPPILVTVVCAIQSCTQIVSLCLTSSVLVSEAVCGSHHVTAMLMSTSMFLAGFTTFLQTTIGVRLPVFQGPTIHYVVPILAQAELSEWKCLPVNQSATPVWFNETSLTDSSNDYPEWKYRLAEISGVLMLVSGVHALIGASGLGGQVSRIIGPLTVAPAVTVMILKMVDNLLEFTFIQLGIASFTLCLMVILTTYMSNLLVPFPTWSRRRGCHITRSRFLKTYAVMISLGCGWMLSHILTISDVFSSDPNSLEYQARTDSNWDTVNQAQWIYIPYPGQFGAPRFSLSLLFGLIVAMLSSVIDSVADYNIVTRLCQIPKAPDHATNRGLLTEGTCSILSGLFGIGHATSTYVAVTGSLVITGVTSLRVFQVAGILLMILGVIGKVGAFLVIIPKPVLGAVMIVVFASVIGTLLAGLSEVDMKKPRNCMTVGLPIMLGTLIPKLVRRHGHLLNTGSVEVDLAIRAMCGTPLFVAGVLACFLDNTLPDGQRQKYDKKNFEMFDKDTHEVYRLPFVHDYLLNSKWTKYCPFLPGFQVNKVPKIDDNGELHTTYSL